MLHVKGTRVLHELSRSYFWPKMAEEIKQFCTACEVCQSAQIQRQNLSSIFRQAAEKDMPLPRQAYGIDFYGHEKEKSSLPLTYALAKPLCGSCPIASKTTLQEP
jgi:hypothetical protein